MPTRPGGRATSSPSSVDIDELVAELRRLGKAEMKMTQNDAASGSNRTARPSAASGARNVSSN